jgi:hypothetical protein
MAIVFECEECGLESTSGELFSQVRVHDTAEFAGCWDSICSYGLTVTGNQHPYQT